MIDSGTAVPPICRYGGSSGHRNGLGITETRLRGGTRNVANVRCLDSQLHYGRRSRTKLGAQRAAIIATGPARRSIAGYSRFSLTRASAEVKCQSVLTSFLFRLAS